MDHMPRSEHDLDNDQSVLDRCDWTSVTPDLLRHIPHVVPEHIRDIIMYHCTQEYVKNILKHIMEDVPPKRIGTLNLENTENFTSENIEFVIAEHINDIFMEQTSSKQIENIMKDIDTATRERIAPDYIKDLVNKLA
ncbi:hypothetical protein VM1G_10595 [Cytospora mali]|uniref:Uncharacterized protein n=1 Tax=Cytospora mali TaxID=578113 RepID=A0A194VJ48_CYTMA|nr:hypothetical protein VM1G_10595 [Valsa mali]